jgi:UDP-N-acetylmuramate: L-alanyl-gamma-D-glutamyl-meso-diaminopimelate ligase
MLAMHIHIVGICGTFMGGLAQLARAAGHRVTGCDANVYPPMSTQLEQAGIELVEGFSEDQLALKPDLWVIGNVATRGMPLIEALLNRREKMISGPQWLSDNILRHHRVLAVAGTHGKTTTSSILAWILEHAGRSPSFLIGGVPENFGCSARLNPNWASETQAFVIEADEYDTAFFDKRSKFLHYPAEIAVLNNLEFDHADIFPDLAAIETQFHHWIRTLPSSGCLVVNGQEPALDRVLARGAFTPIEWFDRPPNWSITASPSASEAIESDGLEPLMVAKAGKPLGELRTPLSGQHNRSNVLAAIAAAVAYGVPVDQAISAIERFEGVKRRMQIRGEAAGVQVLDDFAHHPTAIATTIDGLRTQMNRAGDGGRILAVIEPRSNTMKLGVMAARLADSLRCADLVFAYAGGIDWDLASALTPLGESAVVSRELTELIGQIIRRAQPGDRVLVMSNGGFGGLHDKLLSALSSPSSPSFPSAQSAK